MQVSIETITPEIAQQYLEMNTKNRVLNTRRIADYAKQIERGKWQENGDTVRFAGDRLLDGQHRLHAIILARQPIKTIVVRGLADSAFTTIDTGKVRSGSDALGIAGKTNTRVLAAAIRVVNSYRKGTFDKVAITNDELLTVLNDEPGIEVSVTRVKKYKYGLVDGSILAALHYLFSLVDEKLANDLLKYLHTGDGFNPHSPFHLLRERLISNAAAKAKLNRSDIAALIIKAWNHQRAGTDLRCLKLAGNEPFPTIL